MILRKWIVGDMRGRAILCLCLAVLLTATAAGFWLPAGSAQAWPIIIPIFSSDANLSDLWLSTGGLSPAFAPGTTSYTHNDNNPSTQVKPFAEESHATITVNGTPVTSGNWSPAIPINPGSNTVTVLVTAQDGNTTKTYTITVTGTALPAAATHFAVSAPATAAVGTAFNFTVTAEDQLNNTATGYSGTVHFTSSDATATLPANATLTNGVGTFSTTLKTAGSQTVTATDTATATIKGTSSSIAVSSNAANDANLSDLITNVGQLTPIFAPGTASYAQAYTGPNLLVKPTVEESHATITVNGTAVVSGQWSQAITLSSGPNTITVKVTAQDGATTKTYTINITMPAVQLSSDANLSGITLSTGALTPVFSPNTTAYTQSVDNSVTLENVVVTPEDSNAVVSINGIDHLLSYNNVPLTVGDNIFTVKVTAQDGHTTKTYAVIVTRQSVAPPLPAAPAAPTGLTATASGTGAALSWTDNANNEDGFRIERKAAGGSYSQIVAVGANITNDMDSGLSPGTTYYYRVYAYNASGNSGYSNEASITVPNVTPPVTPPATPTSVVMKFYIGNADYYVNDQAQSMDTAPIISEGRTLLPVRYVATPLGASVDWNQDEQKVTVTLNGKTIELWIGQGTAKVNDTSVPIDPDNSNVTPIVVPPGRTMLPLRFIAEQLGCHVDWNDKTQEVTVIYPQP